MQIIEEIGTWSNSISEMPAIIFSEGSLNNNSAISTLFHVYFDIQWSLVETVFIAVNFQKYSDSSRKFQDKFLKILLNLQENICDDLIYLAFRTFSDVSLYVKVLLDLRVLPIVN